MVPCPGLSVTPPTTLRLVLRAQPPDRRETECPREEETPRTVASCGPTPHVAFSSQTSHEGSLTQKEPSAPEEETETYQQLFQLLLPSPPTPQNGPGYSLINLPESARKHRAWPAPSPLLQKSKFSARKVIPIKKKKKKKERKIPSLCLSSDCSLTETLMGEFPRGRDTTEATMEAAGGSAERR